MCRFSPKQTVARGISRTHSIVLNSIKLNKACTVCDIFWSLATLPANLAPESIINLQMELESDYIKTEMERRKLEQQKDAEDEDPAQRAADAFLKGDETLGEKDAQKKPITP